ncbi:MAG: oligosaccharide flippase family protein [Chthoniobacterales bacterium]|nr:oligosaccharide flippase family protein [Chthoniobacterales bacterium]
MSSLPKPTVADADGSVAEQPIALARRPISSRDFVNTFATNVTIQACTIVQGILLARALGVRGRGEFAAAILWPMFFAGICGFGTQVAVARRSAKSHDPAGLARTAATLALLTGTIGSVLCWFLLPLLMPADAGGALTAARWFVPFVIFNHLALVLMAVDQGSGRFNRYNWTRLIVSPLFLTGVVLLWALSVSAAFWYVIALLVANAGIAVIRLILAMRQPTTRAEHVGPTRLLREALPFGIAGMLGPLFQQADKALLLFLLGTEKLGIYAVALTVSMAVRDPAGGGRSARFWHRCAGRIRRRQRARCTHVPYDRLAVDRCWGRSCRRRAVAVADCLRPRFFRGNPAGDMPHTRRCLCRTGVNPGRIASGPRPRICGSCGADRWLSGNAGDGLIVDAALGNNGHRHSLQRGSGCGTRHHDLDIPRPGCGDGGGPVVSANRRSPGSCNTLRATRSDPGG